MTLRLSMEIFAEPAKTLIVEIFDDAGEIFETCDASENFVKPRGSP